MHSERPKKNWKREYTHILHVLQHLGFGSVYYVYFYFLLWLRWDGRSGWWGNERNCCQQLFQTASWERLKNTFAQLPASYFRKQYFVLLLLIRNFFTFLLDKFSLIGIFCYILLICCCHSFMPFIVTHTHNLPLFLYLHSLKKNNKTIFLEKIIYLEHRMKQTHTTHL